METVLNGLNRRLLGSPLTRIQHRRHHVFAHLFGDFRIACGIPIRAIKVRPSRAPVARYAGKIGVYVSRNSLCAHAETGSSQWPHTGPITTSEGIALISHK
jgi:hypothetical protein